MRLKTQRYFTAVLLLFLAATVLCLVVLLTLAGQADHGQVDPAGVGRHLKKVPYERATGHAVDGNLDGMPYSKLAYDVNDLWRVRESVLAELKQLGEQRNTLLDEIDKSSRELNSYRKQKSDELRQIEKAVETKADLSKQMDDWRLLNSRHDRPMRVRFDFDPSNPLLVASSPVNLCSMQSCFNLSRCPLKNDLSLSVSASRSASVFPWPLQGHSSVVSSTDYACLNFLLVSTVSELSSIDLPNGSLNNVLFLAGPSPGHTRSSPFVEMNSRLPSTVLRISYGLSASDMAVFRRGFDIVCPILLPAQFLPEPLPYLLPVHRKYTFAFRGFLPSSLSAVQETLADTLQSKETLFQFVDRSVAPSELAKSRLEDYSQATFVLLIDNDWDLHDQLGHALLGGAIPVLLEQTSTVLPFEDVIPWEQAVIRWSLQRLPELPAMLNPIGDGWLFERRRQGRLILERIYLDPTKSLEVLLAVLRRRLNLPLARVRPVVTETFYDSSMPMPTYQPESDWQDYNDEMLGPLPAAQLPSGDFLGDPLSSVFSSAGLNLAADPIHSYPSTPFEPILASDAQFAGSSFGFRPVNKGAGGSGSEFSKVIGGNRPVEHFTAVLLTYQREAVLLKTLERFQNLPYLNKVIVIWNSPVAPKIEWPKIGVPIVVVKTKRNSLNNRFIPYDVIDTDAVLSMDDDSHLRHDEIIFAFRVWRERRDQIVGFPGRFHGRSASQWTYNSSHACELSMVLTGAAFLHRFYLYLYTYEMAESIRAKVDQFLNCEDIAMNFLVSHVTRKAPVKATSRWTFICPDCNRTLWGTETHLTKRHDCINLFSTIFGYTPLLYTQFRVDSVLFKTRIPASEQKCFRVV